MQVAQLAGVPKSVIQRAKQRLSELENMQAPSVMSQAPQAFEQLSLMETNHPAIEQLNAVEVNDLSPKMALDLLYKLKEML